MYSVNRSDSIVQDVDEQRTSLLASNFDLLRRTFDGQLTYVRRPDRR